MDHGHCSTHDTMVVEQLAQSEKWNYDFGSSPKSGTHLNWLWLLLNLNSIDMSIAVDTHLIGPINQIIWNSWNSWSVSNPWWEFQIVIKLSSNRWSDTRRWSRNRHCRLSAWPGKIIIFKCISLNRMESYRNENISPSKNKSKTYRKVVMLSNGPCIESSSYISCWIDVIDPAVEFPLSPPTDPMRARSFILFLAPRRVFSSWA